jgi:hypothetical protein
MQADGTATITCVPETDEMMMKLWDRERRGETAVRDFDGCSMRQENEEGRNRRQGSLLFLAIVGNSFHNLRSPSFAQLHAGRRRRRS